MRHEEGEIRNLVEPEYQEIFFLDFGTPLKRLVDFPFFEFGQW